MNEKRDHYLVLIGYKEDRRNAIAAHSKWHISYLACINYAKAEGEEAELRPAWFDRETNALLCLAGEELAIDNLPDLG